MVNSVEHFDLCLILVCVRVWMCLRVGSCGFVDDCGCLLGRLLLFRCYDDCLWLGLVLVVLFYALWFACYCFRLVWFALFSLFAGVRWFCYGC